MVDKKIILVGVAVAGTLGAIGYILYTKSMVGVVKMTVINNCNIPATLCGVTQESGKYDCYIINAGSTTTFNLIKGSQYTLTLNISLPAFSNLKEAGYALQDITRNLCSCMSQDAVWPQCG